MEPYKLKEIRRFVIGIYQSLFSLLALGLIFFTSGWIVKIIMAILCIVSAFWFVYSWKSYKCLKEQTKVYYALIIDENGIQLGYDNGDVVLPWNDISGIRFLRKKEDGVRLGLLVVNHKNGEEVIFNLCRHAPINYFRIRRAIRYFSRREDIVMKSSNLLLMWLRT
jgi:hypothetical protein